MARTKQMNLSRISFRFLFIIALVMFQVCVVCDLHGFSPQEIKNFAGEKARLKRGGESFYNALQGSAHKFYEKRNEFSKSGEILTREIRIKQGRLKGLVREFKNRKLKNVEIFLGIPYAAAPVKALRFMPPGSPPTWKDPKVFDAFGPVCPQRPPDLTREPLKTLNVGQYNRFKGLMPFLTNQSEDCLYLNIYAPQRDYRHSKKFPVIVYVHGESFEWNSGNPYDGSILASYGDVVVVTINFRLGILGFLKPGLSEHTVSNFGLLDQIAALQWIKDNIGEFGGDSSAVTLMGHGTGAACINFLMVSPVSMASEGLFHRAILMSGTALSDWAVTHNPMQFTIQIAEALNCPLLEKNDELSNCLRKKRLSDIMSVKVSATEFQTPFGPIVDGSVVPNTPHQVMGVYQNLFTRYDLLYGFTEWEAYNSLDPVSLIYGMLEEERNEILKKYMYSRFEALPYFALATTLSEYLDFEKTLSTTKSAAEEHRDLVLDLLSDGRFAAPIIQMASYHSKINPKSYLYVFKHKSTMGEYVGSERSVSGEEIPYAFGVPLLNEESPLSPHRFNFQEQLLSEFVLTYFTNFAKTGNPNAPRKVEYLNLSPKEWHEYDTYWPEFDSKNQSYLTIDNPPQTSHHYRPEMIQFWNKILPDLLSNPTKTKQYKSQGPKISHEDKPPFIEMPVPNSSLNHYHRNEDSNSWTYGTVRLSPEEFQKTKSFRAKGEGEKVVPKQMDRPFQEKEVVDLDVLNTHSAWIPHLVAFSVCLVLINGIAIAIYFYKRKETRTKKKRKENTPESIGDGGFEERLKRIESFYSSVNTSQTEQTTATITRNEEEKQSRKAKKFFFGKKTLEGTSKVKKWFHSEKLKKPLKEISKNNTESSESVQMEPVARKPEIPLIKSTNDVSRRTSLVSVKSKKLSKSNDELNKTAKRFVEKVSVGIDATPSSRGDSVLKQTPIELTKFLNGTIPVNNEEDVTQEITDSTNDTWKARFRSSGSLSTSISMQILPTNDDESNKFVSSIEPEIIKLVPKPKNPKNCSEIFSAPNYAKDINVTSRDSENVSISVGARLDPLENIQKRNFPKVLPDFPDFKTVKRLSFPQSILLNMVESSPKKLNLSEGLKSPPPPPPPRISTLKKKDPRISGNRADHQPKFLTFSSVNLKTPEKKPINQSVKSDKNELDKKPNEILSPSAPFNGKSDSAMKNSSATGEKSNKRNREPPSIIIKPKIGPPKKRNLSKS